MSGCAILQVNGRAILPSYLRTIPKEQVLNDQSHPGHGGDFQPAGLPRKQGLYDPSYEKDACGVGFVTHIKGAASHSVVRQAMTVLVNFNHRGASGAEINSGDGAGIIMQLPHSFFATVGLGFELPAAGAYGPLTRYP